MILDLKTARRTLANLANSTSPESSYRIEFLHMKSEMTFSIKKLSIPGNLPPGAYRTEVFEITEEGEKPLSNFDFQIPAKEEDTQSSMLIPQTPSVEVQPPKDINLSILLELRKQDQISHENERQIWETKLDALCAAYEAENRRKDESHKNEIDRINRDWEYKLEITKNNHLLLEAERTKLTRAIESRVKGELKNGSQTEGFDLTKALENPLVLSILGKTLGLEIPNIQAGNGGGIDMAQIMQIASGLMNQTPSTTGKNSIMEILNRGQ
ncbi:hypothetical protein [Leptospira borgpetersenii]|uniref:hypothetical protein n=1 Tax=Leptospira borgpetersenii TaxID=174 RepID=UPI0021594443|nr:hypothetical protein [Leptospira borgpetersenii]UVD74781.1 hypothetical protein NU962_16685 [Leptospira borgpetersenii]UVD77966.1 hypothetical protein LIX27_16755 [Leptospira borgpetersenii]UZW34535.1 hypothetical protein OR565_16760 [Leptospira borgpetersenii]